MVYSRGSSAPDVRVFASFENDISTPNLGFRFERATQIGFHNFIRNEVCGNRHQLRAGWRQDSSSGVSTRSTERHHHESHQPKARPAGDERRLARGRWQACTTRIWRRPAGERQGGEHGGREAGERQAAHGQAAAAPLAGRSVWSRCAVAVRATPSEVVAQVLRDANKLGMASWVSLEGAAFGPRPRAPADPNRADPPHRHGHGGRPSG